MDELIGEARCHRACGDALALVLRSVQLQLAAVERLLAEEWDEPGQPEAIMAPDTATVDTIQLTSRETEVLRLLGDGLSNRRIARTLAISDHTVRTHLQAIYRKLGAAHRTDALIIALRCGLVSLA